MLLSASCAMSPVFMLGFVSPTSRASVLSRAAFSFEEEDLGIVNSFFINSNYAGYRG